MSKKKSMSSSDGYIKVKKGGLFYKKFGSSAIPLIVVHGDPRLGSSYLLPQMSSLAEKYEVIFYDQRGSGKSQDTEISKKFINANQFVDDLETLRTQLGINKFILLSHSLGGPLALIYSIKHPERVLSLILLNSTPISDKGKEAFDKAFDKRILSVKSENSPLDNLNEFQKLTTEQMYKLYKSVTPLLFYNSLNTHKLTLEINNQSAKNGDKAIKLMSKSLVPLLPSLKDLSMPTLIIHGEQDAIPLWTVDELKQAIPNAQLVVFSKCGHFPYIEKPKQLFRVIYDFLADK